MRIVLTKQIIKRTNFTKFPVAEIQRNLASGQKLTKGNRIPSSQAGVKLYALRPPTAQILVNRIATRHV